MLNYRNVLIKQSWQAFNRTPFCYCHALQAFEDFRVIDKGHWLQIDPVKWSRQPIFRWTDPRCQQYNHRHLPNALQRGCKEMTGGEAVRSKRGFPGPPGSSNTSLNKTRAPSQSWLNRWSLGLKQCTQLLSVTSVSGKWFAFQWQLLGWQRKYGAGNVVRRLPFKFGNLCDSHFFSFWSHLRFEYVFKLSGQETGWIAHLTTPRVSLNRLYSANIFQETQALTRR